MRRSLTLLLLMGLGVTLPMGMSSAQSKTNATKVKTLKKSLGSVESKKKAIQSQLKATRRATTYVLQDIKKVDGKLDTVQGMISTNKERLDQLNKESEQLDRDLVWASHLLKEQMKVVSKRFKRLYMESEGTALSALLASESLGDMAAKHAVFDRIAAEDREVFEQFKERCDEVEAKKARKAEVIAETQELIAKQANWKTELKAHMAKKSGYLNELREKEDTLEDQYRSLDRESDAIQAQIRKYQVVNRSMPAFTGRFRRPVNGRITSGYGSRFHPVLKRRRMHAGIDFGAPTGTPIYAAASGVVIAASYRNGYGNTVIIDHGGGLATLYAHCSRIYVSPGQKVSSGARIAAVGSTGLSTGPHLHFEVRVNGKPVNPMGKL